MTKEYEGKTEKEAIEKAAAELGLERDQFDVEILETQKGTLFKKGYARIRVDTVGSADASEEPEEARERRESAPREPVDAAARDEFERQIVEFVKTVVEKMGYTAAIGVAFREPKKLGLRLDSKFSSILIGHKGATLDALQLLANIYAARIGREDMRVSLDTENYRIRREETLARLAYSTAEKARRSGSSILLEPMNPFERRLIHTTLNDVDDIETKSEGEGLYKRVRVIWKGGRA